MRVFLFPQSHSLRGIHVPRYTTIKIYKNSVFMIFLFVYSRIRHALRSGGYRGGFAALRLQNLLVFCPQGEVDAKRTKGVFRCGCYYERLEQKFCSNISFVTNLPDYPPLATQTPPVGENFYSATSRFIPIHK